MKKISILLLNLLFLFPNIALAYSDRVLVGGDNIGINIHSQGVLVVGFYKVNGSLVQSNPAIQVGDSITKVNDTPVETINELTKAIEENMEGDSVSLTFLRNNEEKKSTLTLVKQDETYKTGLYVKDSITGIGTLTYIDPETKIFGSLGHEII